MSFYPKDKTKTIQEALDYIKSFYEAEKTKLQNQAATTFPHSEELENFPNKYEYKVYGSDINLSTHVSRIFFTKSFYNNGYKTLGSEKAINERFEKISEAAKQYISDCQKIHDSNVEKIKVNKEIKNKITDIMDAIGIPNSYRHGYFKTTRSRNKTWETKKAGYIEDLDKHVKTYNQKVPEFKEIIKEIEVQREKCLREIREVESKKEKEKREAQKIQEIALLRAKYTPKNAMADLWEIREALLAKCKYLRLAYWLEKNRGDWNDGYSYAETGLNSFKVENDTDKKIYANISECIESGIDGVDGRVFRDTEWNYTRIRSLCENDDLISDVEKIQEFEENFY
jgi:hypothetical protein